MRGASRMFVAALLLAALADVHAVRSGAPLARPRA